jgi:uncharacterized membrane protein YraQ (UPF0718 family)
MDVVRLLLGPGPAQQVVVVGAIGLYAYLFVTRPADAKAGVRNTVVVFGRLFTLIVAALLIASAIGTLVPTATIKALLGEAAGPQGAILAGLLGGVLPGGPYATYPIIHEIQLKGAGVVGAVAMLVGYGAIGIGRIPYGLVFFDSKTIAIRVTAGIVISIAIALGVFALL